MGLLSGVRILNLTGVLAGPYRSPLLGDPAVGIIKAESPELGDKTRELGPSLGAMTVHFAALKISVLVDGSPPKRGRRTSPAGRRGGGVPRRSAAD